MDGGPAGPAGYFAVGTGGGGSGGQYVFADLTELDDIISQWKTIHEGILTDREALMRTLNTIFRPADDEASGGQFTATVESMRVAVDHNEAMRAYAESYIEKLTAVRMRYAEDDNAQAARMGEHHAQ